MSTKVPSVFLVQLYSYTTITMLQYLFWQACRARAITLIYQFSVFILNLENLENLEKLKSRTVLWKVGENLELSENFL